MQRDEQGRIPRNERLDAFRRHILDVLKENPAGVPKPDLIAAVRSRAPEHFDDAEPCYPGCKNHPRWQHIFDRAIYDLQSSIPRKIHSPRRGVYKRGLG